jgi:Jag N-terminus
MKSIMHEASSLSKAIEQGWLKAGKPQEFTIKILEEPQKNFFGFTTKSAKVALFFEDKPLAKPDYRAKQNPQRYKREKEELRSGDVMRDQSTAQRFQTSDKKERITRERKEAIIAEPTGPKQRQPMWQDDMIRAAETWFKTTLRTIHRESITFKTEQQRWHLRVTLSEPLFDDPQKEKHLLASLATLLLETLKRQFKTGLRGHKIVITHESKSTTTL